MNEFNPDDNDRFISMDEIIELIIKNFTNMMSGNHTNDFLLDAVHTHTDSDYMCSCCMRDNMEGGIEEVSDKYGDLIMEYICDECFDNNCPVNSPCKLPDTESYETVMSNNIFC